ncbi:MAG: DUF805 domain-containing protein [Bacteroidales bacterium]|nr:DUF805 domain-containing protein [Bacteroidales bacterium]
MKERSFLQFFFSFSGCESRADFWPAMIFNFSLSAMLWVPVALALSEGTSFSAGSNLARLSSEQLWLVLPALLLLVVNKWALISRRLHDTGRGFWIYLLLKASAILLLMYPLHWLGFFPLLCLSAIPMIVLFILLCLPSKRKEATDDTKKQR